MADSPIIDESVCDYKGLTGKFYVDLEAEVIRGEVAVLKDVITFQGKTVAEVKTAFSSIR